MGRTAYGRVRSGPMMDDSEAARKGRKSKKIQTNTEDSKMEKPAPKKGIIKPIQNGRRNKGKST